MILTLFGLFLGVGTIILNLIYPSPASIYLVAILGFITGILFTQLLLMEKVI